MKIYNLLLQRSTSYNHNSGVWWRNLTFIIQTNLQGTQLIWHIGFSFLKICKLLMVSVKLSIIIVNFLKITKTLNSKRNKNLIVYQRLSTSKRRIKKGICFVSFEMIACVYFLSFIAYYLKKGLKAWNDNYMRIITSNNDNILILFWP